jgi:hypothetical protein
MSAPDPKLADPRAGKPAAEITIADMKAMATQLVIDGMPEGGRYLMVAAQRLDKLHCELARVREQVGAVQRLMRGATK